VQPAHPKYWRCGHLKKGRNSPRHRRQCLLCLRIVNRRWRKNHPETVRQKNRHFKSIGIDIHKKRNRDRKFGEGATAHYKTQLESQHGRCALCEQPMFRPNQDHDHSCCAPITNKGRQVTKACGKCLRGLLCSPCNNRLGWVEELLVDNSNLVLRDQWLKKAHSYILSWRTVHASTA